MATSIIIRFLDELIQQGMGSWKWNQLVVIMAGVAQQILWSMFSPLPAGDGGTVGIIPYIGRSVHTRWRSLEQYFSAFNQLPSIFGLCITENGVLLILVYVQGMKVEIPLVSTKISRLFCSISDKTNVRFRTFQPILASALTANAVFLGQLLWANFNLRNASPFMNIIGQFDPTSPSTPIGGIIYYITPPRGLDVAAQDPLRAVLYVLFMMGIVVVFVRLWVEHRYGLSPKS